MATGGWRTELTLGVLTALLGLGLAVSVQARRAPSGLALARQDDLVSILADLGTRGQRLQAEVSDLQDTEQRLRTDPAGAAALQEARDRTAELGILAGTVAAHGPGVTVDIVDPGSVVGADVLVDAVEELRDAGAEAIDLSGVRVTTSTSVVDSGTGIAVDGQRRAAPYHLTAIGDPRTLAEALQIPGGVVDTVASAGQGAAAVLTQHADVRILSLHTIQAPRYARPSGP